MKIEGIQFIAFDLDGTLLDSVPDLADAADKTMQALGLPGVTEAQTQTWIGNGAETLIGRALSQSIELDPALDPELHQKALVMFNRFYREGGHKKTVLYPGVTETLETLHQAGIPMAIVTNKPSQFVPHILEEYGISQYFTDVIGGDTFPKKKPDPYALHWLMEKHCLSCSEILMVGDSRNDVLAAQAASCYVVGLTYGYNYGLPISDSHPDRVLDQFSQLLDVVAIA